MASPPSTMKFDIIAASSIAILHTAGWMLTKQEVADASIIFLFSMSTLTIGLIYYIIRLRQLKYKVATALFLFLILGGLLRVLHLPFAGVLIQLGYFNNFIFALLLLFDSKLMKSKLPSVKVTVIIVAVLLMLAYVFIVLSLFPHWSLPDQYFIIYTGAKMLAITLLLDRKEFRESFPDVSRIFLVLLVLAVRSITSYL